MSRVLVTGGAGFIGSHVADAYLAQGHRVWVVDNLSSGRLENVSPGIEFVQMDIRDAALDDLFKSVGGFDVVNHHAAQIDVRKSVMDPALDAGINVIGLLNVLQNALKHGTQRVIFVSSGGVVYGEPEVRPTPETAPKGPFSPYGVTKLTAEYYLHYYHRVHGLEYAAVRYSNVYGPRPDNPQFLTEALRVVDNDEISLEMSAPNRPGLLKGAQGTGCRCFYPVAAGREIAEIEHENLCRLCQKSGHLLVSRKYQLHPLFKADSHQSVPGPFNGRLLNIEGQHPPRFTCKLRKEKRILTVPAGGIHHEVPGSDPLLQKKVSQWNCAVKSSQVHNYPFKQ